MSYHPEQTSGFSYAMAVAMLLHGFVILGITFTSAQYSAPPSQMEVTLSHSNDSHAPEDVDFLAENNQLGSGTEEEANVFLNTEKRLFEDAALKPVDPLVLPKELQSDTRTDPRVITTTGDSPQLYVVQEDIADNENNLDGDAQGYTLAELSRKIASIEAKLAERQQLFTRKPRRKVFTSASTMAATEASYIHSWTNRIEHVGNLHYPDAARDNKLYGDVRVRVGIDTDGTVTSISILESSGNQVLDDAARESILLSSPFEPFTGEMARDYDRIEIIRTWQFRKNRLTTEH